MFPGRVKNAAAVGWAAPHLSQVTARLQVKGYVGWGIPNLLIRLLH